MKNFQVSSVKNGHMCVPRLNWSKRRMVYSYKSSLLSGTPEREKGQGGKLC